MTYIIIFCSQQSQKKKSSTKKGLKNFDWPCHFPPGFRCVCVCVCSCSFRKVLGNFTLLLTFPFVPHDAVDPLDVVLQKTTQNDGKNKNEHLHCFLVSGSCIFQPWALLQPNPVDASENPAISALYYLRLVVLSHDSTRRFSSPVSGWATWLNSVARIGSFPELS